MGFPVYPLSWKGSAGYKEAGYFPETVTNFLALLGWNPGTEQEVFSLKELVGTFSLDRVTKAGARFDPEKTKWYNHYYLQQKPDRELAEIFMEHISGARTPNPPVNSGFREIDTLRDPTYVEKVVSLIKERANFVSDFWELGAYFFVPPDSYNEKAVKKQWKEDTPGILSRLASELEKIDDFTSPAIETKVKLWLEETKLSFGKVMPVLRLVIVGDMKGPHLFDIIGLIGKKESVSRIQKAIATL
jgi:glutamyl-tRNA synthetase